MEHFSNDIGPEYRWKNDLLNELRKQTALLEKIVEQTCPIAKDTTVQGGMKSVSARRTRKSDK